MKIFIISTNAIGDTYLSAAAIAPLRAHFGGTCEITLLTNTSCRELAKYLDVDRAVFLPSRSIGEVLRCCASLMQNRYDYVFSFFPGRINSLFLFACRAGKRVGCVNFRYIKEWHPRCHAIYVSGGRGARKKWTPDQTFLDLVSLSLSAAKIPAAGMAKPRLATMPVEKAKEPCMILIHAHSSQMNKSLSVEAVHGLVQYLSSRMQTDIAMIGWNNDLMALKNEFQFDKRTSFLENLSLPAFVGRIRQSLLFIGVDSFPLHLADAYQIRSIGIFGPTRSASFSPTQYSIDFGCVDLSQVDAENLIRKFGPACDSVFQS